MSQSLREGGFRTASAEASLPFLRSHVRKMILEKNRKKKIKIFFFSRIVYNQGVKHKFQNTCMEIIKEILGGASWEY